MERSELGGVRRDWQSQQLPPRMRYDGWVHMLNSTYGSWGMSSAPEGRFAASLQTQRLGEFLVANCVCDPCTGHRGARDVLRESREVLAIQLTLSGRERFHLGDDAYELGPGDLIVWDDTQTMTFDVVERLHKVTAILPLRRVQDWLPGNWSSIPRKLSAASTDGMLLASHLRTLADADLGAAHIRGEALAEATVALLAGAVGGFGQEEGDSARERRLEAVKAYIDEHLDDPELSPMSVAVANRISLRYLHWLFSFTDSTVARFVMEQRLLRCRRDLLNPLMAERKVADIAFSWGFTEPAHFSRRFREFFGERPSDLRPGRR